MLLERRKIGLSHSISAFESVKPLSKRATKYDFNSFQLVLFRVQKRTRYIILIPCKRIILENTFIQGNVKLTGAYIRRKRIAQTVAKNAVTVRKRSSRKPPGVRSQTQYIQPVTRAKDGLYHIGFTQRVTPVTGTIGTRKTGSWNVCAQPCASTAVGSANTKHAMQNSETVLRISGGCPSAILSRN